MIPTSTPRIAEQDGRRRSEGTAKIRAFPSRAVSARLGVSDLSYPFATRSRRSGILPLHRRAQQESGPTKTRQDAASTQVVNAYDLSRNRAGLLCGMLARAMAMASAIVLPWAAIGAESPGGPVFHTAAFGEWDGGCVFASPNLVELPDGSFLLPYTGYNFPHKYPRGQLRFLPGYMVWPRGRLVGLEAAERGEFATAALIPPARKVLINAVTKRTGSLLVEVAGLDEVPLKGRSFAEADPIVGDQFRKPLTWKGQAELAPQPGTPVMLRFRMDKATLFGLDFVE